ncbi:MAG: peptidylprolyl isomerase [Planctomycetes bacterium]|nr:peptidylprolyl isomerase [Planctomycetota bacterium]
MAKHKAPTQITIGSIQQQTLFNELVERYWKLGATLLAAGAIAILIPTYLNSKARTAHHSLWDDLSAQAELGGGFRSIQGGPPESLALFADQHKDSRVGGWAKALEVGGHIEGDELDRAEKAAAQLEELWPDHVLSRAKLYRGSDGSARSLSESILSEKGKLGAWEKEHSFLFSNPDLPPDAPRLRLNTSKGPIVVGLYVDRTPQHSANFLELAKAGFYNGTKFHRVVRGKLIQGGDPNTIAGEPDSWGLGGPESTLELELDPRLRHFRGVLVAWRADNSTRSHGSQFFLTTSDQHEMDGQTVVFGRTLEGDATIEAIESGAVVEDRPQDPVVIESIEVL